MSMQAERRYEVLMLTVPEITQDEAKNLEKNFADLIAKENGSLISFERWGKYRLPYPVKKNAYGVYFLARFSTANTDTAAEAVKTMFAIRFDSLVMRHVITLLDSKASLEYQRPRSLEEAPPEEAGGMFKSSYRRDRFAGPRGGGRRDDHFNRNASVESRTNDFQEVNDLSDIETGDSE